MLRRISRRRWMRGRTAGRSAQAFAHTFRRTGCLRDSPPGNWCSAYCPLPALAAHAPITGAIPARGKPSARTPRAPPVVRRAGSVRLPCGRPHRFAPERCRGAGCRRDRASTRAFVQSRSCTWRRSPPRSLFSPASPSVECGRAARHAGGRIANAAAKARARARSRRPAGSGARNQPAFLYLITAIIRFEFLGIIRGFADFT